VRSERKQRGETHPKKWGIGLADYERTAAAELICRNTRQALHANVGRIHHRNEMRGSLLTAEAVGPIMPARKAKKLANRSSKNALSAGLRYDDKNSQVMAS